MKQLQPVIAAINSLILEQLKVSLRLDSADSLLVGGGISRLLLGLQADDWEPTSESVAAENGLIIEGLKFGLEGVDLPSPTSPGVGATLRVDEVTLKFAPAFWQRASVLAKDPLVANLGKLLDRIHVRGLRIKVSLDPYKVLDVTVTQEHLEITLAGRPGVTVDHVDLTMEGFDLQEKNKKLAVKQSRLILRSVTTKVAEEFLNRAVDVARKKIPSMVQSIDFDLGYERMLVTSKLSVFPMAIPTELTFSAEDNLFGIYIVKVAIGLARPIILGIVKNFAKNRPEVKVMDSKLFINPWGKIPITLFARLKTFAIADRCIVVGFADPGRIPERENARPRALPAPAAVAEEMGDIVVTSVDPAPAQNGSIPPLP